MPAQVAGNQALTSIEDFPVIRNKTIDIFPRV